MHSIYLTLVAISIHLYKCAWIANAFLQQVQRCPRMCNCGLYMGLNMANCSGENLINANIGMSSLVEFFDLSNNDITTIDNQCFNELRHLKIVALGRNSISSIELDAFLPLDKLQIVNLTHNRLELFDNRIFEQNIHLVTVDLSGNKFMHLPNAPILRSVSLEKLDLHGSQLTHLHVKYFEELPNIRFIDLSGNLLIVLNLAAFATNNRLQELNVQANRFRCDEQTEKTVIWLNRNQVDVLIDNCPKKQLPPIKFERLKLSNASKPFEAHEWENDTSVNLDKVWNTHNKNDHNIPILDERCQANETTAMQACRLFETCISNLTMLVDEVEAKLLLKSGNTKVRYDTVRLHHTWYDLVTVQVAFYGGLFMGTMLGAVLLFVLKLISDCAEMFRSESGRELRRKRRNRQYADQELAIDNNIERNNETIENDSILPIEQAIEQRSVTRDGPYPNHQSSTSRQSSTSFFAIFYERPVRRRYYRQFNRSATNLVRRLSQSRLFLNSSRAQNAAYRQNNPRRHREEPTITSNETESMAMFDDADQMTGMELTPHERASHDSLYRIHASVHSLNISNENHQNATENRLSAIRTFASESDLYGSCARSETPPPPYNDVAQALSQLGNTIHVE